MGQRFDLQLIFESILGTQNVYFQPPSNVQMSYPAIVYQRDSAETIFASNLPYRSTTRYQVTVIDRNVDSDIPGEVSKLPLCTFERYFVSDNLNHDVYTLYY